MIAADSRAVPDLHFDVHLIVVADNTVACRLQFNRTPHKHVLRV